MMDSVAVDEKAARHIAAACAVPIKLVFVWHTTVADWLRVCSFVWGLYGLPIPTRKTEELPAKFEEPQGQRGRRDREQRISLA